MKFSIKDFFNKCDETLNGKLYFLCSVSAAEQLSAEYWCSDNACIAQKMKFYVKVYLFLEMITFENVVFQAQF